MEYIFSRPNQNSPEKKSCKNLWIVNCRLGTDFLFFSRKFFANVSKWVVLVSNSLVILESLKIFLFETILLKIVTCTKMLKILIVLPKSDYCFSNGYCEL